MDERKLSALRELLDPEVVAAWLDEVESHRTNSSRPRFVTRTPEPLDTRILTATEAAQRLRVSPHVVYELVRRNEIPHVRVGRSIRLGSAVLDDWIANGGVSPVSTAPTMYRR